MSDFLALHLETLAITYIWYLISLQIFLIDRFTFIVRTNIYLPAALLCKTVGSYIVLDKSGFKPRSRSCRLCDLEKRTPLSISESLPWCLEN